MKISVFHEDISVSKQERFNFDSVHLLSYRTILAEVILLILYICWNFEIRPYVTVFVTLPNLQTTSGFENRETNGRTRAK